MKSFNNYPIVEGISMGGIKIGEKMDSSSEVFQFLKEFYDEYDRISLIYTYNNSIKLYCNKDTKLVYKISAKKGYSGKFKNLITIGDTIYDLINLKTSLLYDDFNHVFFLKGYRGICFESDNFDGDLRKIRIDFITIYNTILDTEESINDLVTVSSSTLFNIH